MHALGAAAALTVQGATLAQSAPADPVSPDTLPSVVITGSANKPVGYRAHQSASATGMDLSLRETPQAVSVITRAQMDDFGLNSINDALATAPGVIVEKVETDRTYYSARGFDITNFQLDGVGMPFTNGSQWGSVDTAVYERVDVLRGANGLLSATGFPSATINFVTKKPTSVFQASAGLGVGSWQGWRADADLAGALTEDRHVRGRLVVVKQAGNSYLDRYAKDNSTLYGVVDVDLGPSTLLSLSHLAQTSKADSPMWGALPLNFSDGSATDYGVSNSTAADWAWWDNTDQRSQLSLTHDFDTNWQGRMMATRRASTADSELFYVYGTPDKATGLGLASYPSSFKGDYLQHMLNLQLSGAFMLAGRRHELVLGATTATEHAQEHSGYGNDIGTPLPDLATWDGRYTKPDFTVSSNGSNFRTRREMAFAVMRFNLADDLKLITGANATRVSASGNNYGVGHAYALRKLTPYAGLVWTMSPELSVYGSFTRIFNPQTEVDANRQVLAPVQGRNIELGLKGDSLDKRLGMAAALFDTRQQNLAAFAGSFPDFTSYFRGENARSQGVELEASGRVGGDWELSASLTRLRLTGDDGANVRTYTPRGTARLSARWQASPALKVGAQVAWQSGISRDQGAGVMTRQAAYALLDLMASYEFNKHWSASLNLHNVANEKYLTSLYWSQAYYGAPRNGTLSVRWTE